MNCMGILHKYKGLDENMRFAKSVSQASIGTGQAFTEGGPPLVVTAGSGEA